MRVPGTAVFMTGNPHIVPMAMLHNLRLNNVVHERVVIMTVRVRDEPHVADPQRVVVEKLGKGFYRVIVNYGFMDEPDVPRALVLCRAARSAGRPRPDLVLPRRARRWYLRTARK